VALDTVKKHVTHILGKLGAANRTEAVARARQLGLIPAGACGRAGLAWQFGLAPENGLGQFDA
jgi:hypothetical protein